MLVIALLLVAGAGVASLSGGDGEGDRDRPVLTEGGEMKFVSTRPPRSRGSRPGPASLAFVSPRTGFAATTGGMHFVPNTGWVAGRDRGRIERTDDGGVTWRTLWSARRAVLRSIAVSGRVIVAAGYRALPMRCCPAYEPLGQGLVVDSRDGGRTWRRRDAPTRRGDVEVLGPRTWVMYGRPNDKGYAMRRAVVFRSDDAGRRWRRLALPRGAGFVRLVTPLIGVAGARGVQCARASQLWRTADGGQTWRAVPETCGPKLIDLEVVSARRLVAAQADGEDADRPRSVVRRSDDGGSTWTVVRRERGKRIVRLAFADARRGLAVHWRPHDYGRIIDVLLRATADGGRTWTSRSLPYARYPFASSRTFGAENPTASVGPGHAWAGDQAAGIVWRTTDAGRTWRLSAEPRTLKPSEPELSGPRRALSVWTAAGPATSGDGGRTWSLSRSPSERAAAVAERRNAYLALGTFRSRERDDVTGEHDEYMAPGLPTVTPDRGATWRRVRLPRHLSTTGAGAVAFTSGRDGLIAGDAQTPQLPVFSTHDGGRASKVVNAPPLERLRPTVVLGPGIVVLTTGSRAHVTVDEGRAWQSFPLGDTLIFCDVSRPSDADIWLACTNSDGPRRLTVLLTSNDGGRTWARRTTTKPFGAHLAAVNGREAWADSGVLRADKPGPLWHTTDGGVTWRQEWVSLSPHALVKQVVSGG